MAGAATMNTGEIFNEVVHGKGRLHDPLAVEGERTYAMFMHLMLIVAHMGVPIAPTLIMWAIKKDKSPFIDDHGREALNFQISLIIYWVGILLLGLVTCGLAWVLYVPFYVLAVAGMVLAAIAANKGDYYRYPMTIRFLS